MSESTMTQRERTARRYAGTLILAAASAATIVTGFSYAGWQYLTDREDRLERREARLDQREADLRGLQAAVDKAALENEKQRLALLQEKQTIEAAQAQLQALDGAIVKQRTDLLLQQQRVGIDAQEAALREEARQLIAEYTALMSKPENRRDDCTVQAARNAGKPMLDRVSTIGGQLRNGADLQEFANNQRVGFWRNCGEHNASAKGDGKRGVIGG